MPSKAGPGRRNNEHWGPGPTLPITAVNQDPGVTVGSFRGWLSGGPTEKLQV